MKPKKGKLPEVKYSDDINVMQWNDATKPKSVKFVSMLLTIIIFDLIDSNKTDQTTEEIIQIPDVIID